VVRSRLSSAPPDKPLDPTRVSTPTPPDLSALSPLAPELAGAIAALVGDIALVLDGDGVIRSVANAGDSAACAGWVGRPWLETASPDTRPKLEKLLAEVRSGGVARRREVNHPVPEGEAIPLAWSALRLGSSGALIAVGRDLRAVAAIQQRFLDTQQELERVYWQRRQDESRGEQLHQVEHDALFVLDAATLRVTEANNAALALLGEPAVDVRGRMLSDLLPPGLRPALTDLLAGARAAARAGEVRLRASPHAAPIDWAATPLRARAGQLLLLRARPVPAPEPLALPGASAAVLVVDAAARVQLANAKALHALDVGQESQLRGRTLAEVVGAVDAPQWLALLDRVRAEGLVARTALGAGGRRVEVTAALLTEGEQEAVGLVWQPRGSAPRAAPVPTETLRELAAQLGDEPLERLLARGRDEIERHLIASALWRAAGSADEAARLLGVTADRLALRMHALGLPAPGAVS
jgi:transcriptional regulator PpsR